MEGAQWLCWTMLDSILRSSLVYPHLRHCIMCLTKTHKYLHTTGSTHEEPSRHNWKRVDWDVKNQIKQTNKYFHTKIFKNVSSVYLFTNWSFWQAFIIFFYRTKVVGLMRKVYVYFSPTCACNWPRIDETVFIFPYHWAQYLLWVSILLRSVRRFYRYSF